MLGTGLGTGIDEYYIILVAPTILLTMWVQFKLKSTFSKYAKVPSSRKVTGQQTASHLLKTNNINDVRVVKIAGNLTDHYSNSAAGKQVALSDPIHDQTSIAAIGVAAHEVGHAVQYARGYSLIAIRNPIRKLSNFGSSLGPILVAAGLASSFPFLTNIGILFFSGAVLFSLLTLPVEFNASKRALVMLQQNNILTTKEEIRGAKKVLSASAFTYVAGTISAIANLLRLILKTRGGQRRRR